ncbi:uncharacterized protein DMAD_00413 [Drosophila madeirensis]|uniref:Uncharacterized protein n=1 Tax=Drosophila madeirensis TaxID=30013 RepID=A0AAU9FXS1_DROMD
MNPFRVRGPTQPTLNVEEPLVPEKRKRTAARAAAPAAATANRQGRVPKMSVTADRKITSAPAAGPAAAPAAATLSELPVPAKRTIWDVIQMERTAMEELSKMVANMLLDSSFTPYRHRGGAWTHGDPRHPSMLDLDNIMHRVNTRSVMLMPCVDDILKLLSPLKPVGTEADNEKRLGLLEGIQKMSDNLKKVHEKCGMPNYNASLLPPPPSPARRADYKESIERKHSLNMLWHMQRECRSIFYVDEEAAGTVLNALVYGREFEGFDWYIKLLHRVCENVSGCSECSPEKRLQARYSISLLKLAIPQARAQMEEEYE